MQGDRWNNRNACPQSDSESCTMYNVCLVHWGVFSTLEGYLEYVGGMSVHWGEGGS